MLGIVIGGVDSDIEGLREAVKITNRAKGEELPRHKTIKQINDNRIKLTELLAQKKPIVYIANTFKVPTTIIKKWILQWSLEKQSGYLNL